MLPFIQQHIYPKVQHVLVLGFYNRNNAGDEMYKIVIPKIFSNTKATFTFICMDDIHELPSNIDFIICGGGDIINSYFMTKAEKLFANYTGRIYAFSLGIPYETEARYLHVFDHVFVRSLNDYKIAMNEIGSKNVTYLPDASTYLIKHNFYTNQPILKLGICLAQPAFYNNPAAETILNSVIDALYKLYTNNKAVEFHLISFNYSKDENKEESDYCINKILYDRLLILDSNFPVFFEKNIEDPMSVFNMIKTMDVVLCMRYHSVLFSYILQKTIIALYCSPKVDNVIKDLSKHVFAKYKLPIDAKCRPNNIDTHKLYEMLNNALLNKNHNETFKDDVNWDIAKKIMFDDKSIVKMLIKTNIESFDNTLFRCKKFLTKYLDITSSEYEHLLNSKVIMNYEKHDATNIARLICYCITKSIQSSYIWGLAENMKHEDFCLYDAIKYIWEDCNTKETDNSYGEQYYPEIKFDRQIFVNLDYMFQNDFKHYHRSGWSYVVGGMMNIDGHQLVRNSSLMIDTYVDRSFHWGLETLETVGIIPYTANWVGFIHHTFDISHSSYNCVELFTKPAFLESLKYCKGLIALTDYLKKELQIALISKGFYSIPVYTIYHPMETVDNMFTLDKFLENKNRKIIQIGAWLRNSYAVYELSLWKNKLNLQKCALRGKDMDNYFKPHHFLKKIKEFLYEDSMYNNNPIGVSGNQVNNYSYNSNKYCSELYNMIYSNDKSVKVIERLTNDEYDQLLSENIVFLNLVDCSAVNTVLECLVRNTVIIINRHPAVEEILGEDYPCFYDDMIDATLLINDFDKIKAAYACLKKINKTRYQLDYFMKQLQKVLLS